MLLYPSRKPYQQGYIGVGQGHRLYYALYGNPKGVPVLFVHGGPGSGCGERAHRFFNPKRFNILALDQRGAGKSKPYASITANTTQHLVKDIKAFLDFLGIKKTYLFGGSWGSCLSLCYAIRYPRTVLGMVLRGIYLGTKQENDYLFKGGPAIHFPDVWERFISVVPQRQRSNLLGFYWRKMNSRNPRTATRFCRAWALYELSMLQLEYDPKKVLKETKGKNLNAFARIEAWYIKNNAFLTPHYIMRNARKLRAIPAAIIHGRYDVVCTPRVAYQLHKALPGSTLSFVTGGHSAKDPAVREGMMKAIHAMAAQKNPSAICDRC